jgi:hypothetical protein
VSCRKSWFYDHLWSSLTALIRARRAPCEIFALTPHAPHPVLLE